MLILNNIHESFKYSWILLLLIVSILELGSIHYHCVFRLSSQLYSHQSQAIWCILCVCVSHIYRLEYLCDINPNANTRKVILNVSINKNINDRVAIKWLIGNKFRINKTSCLYTMYRFSAPLLSCWNTFAKCCYK